MPRERDIAHKVQSLLASVPQMSGGQDKFSDLAKRATKQSAKKQHIAEMEGVRQEIASMPDKIGAFTNVNKRKAKRELTEREDAMRRYGFGHGEVESVRGCGPAQSRPATEADTLRKELREILRKKVVDEMVIADWNTISQGRKVLGVANKNDPAQITAEKAARANEAKLAREYGIGGWDTRTFGLLREAAAQAATDLPKTTARINELRTRLAVPADLVAEWGAPVARRGLIGSGLRGGMEGLKIDTAADVDYSTKLTKAKVAAIRKKIADIDTDADNMSQYREIKAILSPLKEDDFTTHDWREIEALLSNIDPLLAGKRGSKPHEFISILEKVFDRVQGSGRRVLKKGGCWECRGGGPIPDRNILQQIADQSYKDMPSQEIGQLELVRATPTLKFYKAPDNTIVVGIRGTKPTDVDDVKADAMIGVGQLESAPRYMRDLQTLQQFQLTYPPSQYDYYGVGHSLGGAILDMFLKKGLIKNGVSYNPAVQPQDFANTTLPNSRVYMESDPLYALMGKNLTKKPETRAPRKKAWWEKAISAIPYVGNTAAKTYDLYQSHMLDQFQGGFLGMDMKDVFNPMVSNDQLKQKQKAYYDAQPKAPPIDWKKMAGTAGKLLSQFSGGAKPHSKFATQLKKAGIEPSLYLKEAQRRAKEAGLPYKLLGFADDGEHKLSIPNAEGQMRKFGAVGYGDHLIWKHLEDTKRVPLGTADGHRNRFQKSHSKIKGDWKKDPFSPNNLALKILW